MGTGSGAMAWFTVLFLVLHSLPHLLAQCCNTKIVTGALAEEKGLAGTYSLLTDVADARDAACADGCVYSREGREGEEYCFQAVAAGADIEDQECDAVTGATAPPGSQTSVSSDELRQQALDAAAEVEANNALIVEGNQNIANGEATTDFINTIQQQLSSGATTPAGRLRDKRQATDSPTPMPVEEPTNCAEFRDSYVALLDLAQSVTDDNIDQIKVYVDALKNVDVQTLCDATERASLASDTNTDADNAIQKTKEYTDAEEVEINELKKKVNEKIAEVEEINAELEDRNETPVTIESLTYAIEAATPSMQESSPQPGAETAVPMTEGTPDPGAETPVVMTEGTQPAGGETPEGTQPVGGETPEGTQPAGGETPEGTQPAGGETPEGTQPAGGETPEGTQPAGGETPEGTQPAGGETPEGTQPAGGETSEGPSAQVSTAKPGRLLFEKRRRSRGSIF